MGRLHRGLGDVLVTDARCVDERLVGQVHQVIDEQSVVAFGVHGLPIAFPFRIVVPMHVRHQRWIGQRGVARPYPDETMAFDIRERFHACRWVEFVLRRHARAFTVAVKGEAVIPANDLIPVKPAKGKRQ